MDLLVNQWQGPPSYVGIDRTHRSVLHKPRKFRLTPRSLKTVQKFYLILRRYLQRTLCRIDWHFTNWSNFQKFSPIEHVLEKNSTVENFSSSKFWKSKIDGWKFTSWNFGYFRNRKWKFRKSKIVVWKFFELKFWKF